MTIQISTAGDRIEIAAPFRFKDHCKAIGGGRWNPNEKRWVYPATVQTAQEIVSTFNGLPWSGDDGFQSLIHKLERQKAGQKAKHAEALPEPPSATRAWLHQRQAWHFMRDMDAGMLAMEMGCISGDAEISVHRCGITRRMTLAELHRHFNNPKRRPSFRHDKPWLCRALKGDRFGLHKIEAVIDKGKKPVLRLSLSGGKALVCTPDHEICCPGSGDAANQWRPAGDLAAGDEVLVNGARAQAGDKNPNWKGGRFVDSDGYVRVTRQHGHPRANPAGQVYEHILVMEKELGHFIGREVHIHHVDHDKTNNDPSNLRIMTPREHYKEHDLYKNLDGGTAGTGGTIHIIPKIAKVISIEDVGEHQVFDIVMADPHRNFVANGVVVHNCGKSKVAVDLVNLWDCRRILVVCPLSVVGVWPREFARHSLDAFECLSLNKGNVERKLREAQKFLDIRAAKQRKAVVIVNHEAVWREPFGTWALGRAEFDCVILDESHRAKQHNGRLSKYMWRLGAQVQKRLALTGTPMPHSPMDIFAQYRYLDPGVYGQSYHRFRMKYAVMGGFEGKQIIGFQNQGELNERMYRLAFRVTKDEALDLPEQVHEYRTVTLGKKAQAIYERMEKLFYAEVDAGEVTAANALVKLLRLQQITSGYLQTDEGAIEEVDDTKAKALKEELETMATPVTVVCRFRHDLAVVRGIAGDLRLSYGEISGAQKDLTTEATMPEGIDVMGVQIQSGGVGIDLTRAHNCILYSVGFNLGDYEQFLSRQHRPGQTNKVTYVHLACEKTVDIHAHKALENRKNAVEAILNWREDR